MPTQIDTQTADNAEARVPLSRERVLRAAIELADAGGIASLSMRRLGHALGVEAMSLYHHVANKDDILNGILELVLGEIARPPDDIDWKAAIRVSALSAHDVLLRHPWACSLMMSPAGICPPRLRWMDAILRTVREAGCSAELTHHAYHALESHISGFTLWLVNLPALGEELNDMAVTVLRELAVADYPYLAEHIQYHLTGVSPDDKTEFEFGLDLILDGLERLRDTG